MKTFYITLSLLILSISCLNYDIIIVGSGPGGSVAAHRAVQAGYSVLLLERGKPYTTVSAVDDPAQTALTRSTVDTGYTINSLPQYTALNLSTPRVFSVKDAAYAGGATAINGLIHAHGQAQSFFDTYWPSNWDWNTMSEYFKKYETYDGVDPNNTRGDSGPVHVTERTPALNNLTEEFINGTIANWPNVRVVHNINTEGGVGTSSVETTSFGGHRVTSYSAYVRDLETAGNLTFMTNSLVKRVLFDNNNRANGVEVINLLTNETTNYTAAEAVIVAAGTLGTPQLLQRSGVGDSNVLTPLGIPVVSHIPEVGQSLDDHSPTVTLIFNGPAPWVDGEGVLYGWIYWNHLDNATQKMDFSIILNTVSNPPNNIKTLSLAIANRKSRGSINITSTDPSASPSLDFGWLAEQEDIDTFTEILNQTLGLVDKLGWAFTPIPTNNPCNTTICFDKASTAQTWIKSGMIGPGYHFTSTARIDAVVNKNNLEVKGTSRLFVNDASIFPKAPIAGTQSPVYAVVEHGIKLILDNITSANNNTSATSATNTITSTNSATSATNTIISTNSATSTNSAITNTNISTTAATSSTTSVVSKTNTGLTTSSTTTNGCLAAFVCSCFALILCLI